MKKITALVLLICLICSASTSFSMSVVIPPKLLEAAISLFPDQKGPYELHVKSDLRMHRMGFEIINYVLMANSREAGVVTRIKSVIKDGPAGSVDILARYDEKGRLVGIKNMAGPAKTGESFDVLYYMLLEKDPKQYKDALTIIANGLAAGSTAKDAASTVALPKDFVLDLRQKIFTPGALLPVIKAQDINGREFDTANYKAERLVMIFTSVECIRCDDMLKAAEKGAEVFGKKEKVQVVYVVSADRPAAADYAKASGLNGTVLAEPSDNVSKMFQVPFKPYALMFDKGVLKFNVPWEGEDKFLGYFYLFTGGTGAVGKGL